MWQPVLALAVDRFVNRLPSGVVLKPSHATQATKRLRVTGAFFGLALSAQRCAPFGGDALLNGVADRTFGFAKVIVRHGCNVPRPSEWRFIRARRGRARCVEDVSVRLALSAKSCDPRQIQHSAARSLLK